MNEKKMILFVFVLLNNMKISLTSEIDLLLDRNEDRKGVRQVKLIYKGNEVSTEISESTTPTTTEYTHEDYENNETEEVHSVPHPLICAEKIEEEREDPEPIYELGQDLCITKQGIEKMERDDMAAVIYMTAVNDGEYPLELYVSMRNCCLLISPGQVDCEVMKLIGGRIGIVKPHEEINLTLLYPNLYLYDRIGECYINIYNDRILIKIQRIAIDTSLVCPESSKYLIPDFMRSFYSQSEVEDCDTVDLDRLDSCLAMDCRNKYQNRFSYFNWTTLLCEPLESCDTEYKDQLPTSAYVWELNKCVELTDNFSQADLLNLAKNVPQQQKLSFPNAPVNVHCHHGHPDILERWCICDEGWQSVAFDQSIFNRDTMMYHMCTLPKGPNKLLLFIIGAILLFLMIAIAIGITYAFFSASCPQKRNKEENKV